MENEVMAKVERLAEVGEEYVLKGKAQLRPLSPIADSVARSFYMKIFGCRTLEPIVRMYFLGNRLSTHLSAPKLCMSRFHVDRTRSLPTAGRMSISYNSQTLLAA